MIATGTHLTGVSRLPLGHQRNEYSPTARESSIAYEGP